MGWNWLDGAIFGILAVSIVAAIWEGLIREVISLVSVAVGLGLAATEYWRAAPWFERRIHSTDVANGVAFLALFAGVVIAGSVIGYLLRSIVRKVGLGWFDRFLGGIFGLVRGVAIVSIMLLAAVTFSIQQNIVQNSVLAPYFLLGARVVGATLPDDLGSRFQKGLEIFRKALVEKDKKTMGK